MTDFPWDEPSEDWGAGLSSLDYWRLCDELTVLQAAMLLVGCDPSGENAYAENWKITQRPEGYEAAKAAISRAIASGGVEGSVREEMEYDNHGNPRDLIEGTVCPNTSYVKVESLKQWLKNRGFRSGFFFAGDDNRPEYLDPTHSRYAPKLAAAVNAWQSLENESKLAGKSPKIALSKWLRENAADYGLSDDDGKPNEAGIEQVSKVANWSPGGGAPKTS